MKRCWIALLVFFLSLCATAQETKYLQGLGDTRYHRLESEILNRGFHVYTRLPEGYDPSKRTVYPTVYLLDGGTTYPLLAGYYRYLRLGEEVPDMILVGISYGSVDWGSGNMRSTDFTAPSKDRDYWGGAATFQKVLSEELIPFIENSLKSDPDYRIIFGQSLGGQFVLFTALESNLFWGHIASNPALHRNLDYFSPDNHENSRSTGQRLFVTSGTEDDRRFRKPAVSWMKAWNQHPDPPWELNATDLSGETHFSAAPRAFREGITWLFKK